MEVPAPPRITQIAVGDKFHFCPATLRRLV
jgi:hypothetical protein